MFFDHVAWDVSQCRIELGNDRFYRIMGVSKSNHVSLVRCCLFLSDLSAAASVCFISHIDITEGYKLIIRLDTTDLGIAETFLCVYTCMNVL